MRFDKKRLRALLLAQLRRDIVALTRTQADASEGATHSESRAEHSKDTRATEQSYLARGLAERVEELRDTEARLAKMPLPSFEDDDPIGVGALVRIREEPNGDLELWWLVPHVAGAEIEQDGEIIRTLTPGSPLGQTLVGMECGDDGVFETPRGKRNFTILEVQ